MAKSGRKLKQENSMDPIFHTLSAQVAIRRPAHVITRSRQYVQMTWLPGQAERFANDLIDAIGQRKQPTWACISGPFGFGKTAISNALTWRFHEAGLIALPPISAVGFSEYGKAVATLLKVLAPERCDEIATCWKGIEQTIRKGRRSPVHGLIDFLTSMTGAGGIIDRPLIIQLDELQQLLGALDADSLIAFREFVWGLRTENLNLGIILVLDTFLESRLERWAADILHRIREQGNRLALHQTYEHRFPSWLWQCWREHGVIDKDLSLSPALMESLGQYVERWDLAYGPRTVVEVFQRALKAGVDQYDVEAFVRDICLGRFRFLPQESNAAKAILRVLGDSWVRQDARRQRLMRILAAFPNGCPQAQLTHFFPDAHIRQALIDEAFGPLLVRAKNGVALECLQPVQRSETFLDELIQKTWHLMPSYKALVAQAPKLFGERLLGLIFPEQRERGEWRLESTPWPQWFVLQGNMEGFRNRKIAVCFEGGETDYHPDDVDLVLRFRILGRAAEETDADNYRMNLTEGDAGIQFDLPVLQPAPQGLPMGMDRYRKFLDPEPMTALHLLVLLRELDAIDGKAVPEAVWIRLKALVPALEEVITKVLIRGEIIDSDTGTRIFLRGEDLIRALISRALHQMYPHYVPLPPQESLAPYLKALASGIDSIEGTKQAVYRQVFDMTSTAGQSYARTLGPLVCTSGTPSQFRLKLTLHPAEQMIIDLMEASDGQCPVMTVIDMLLCRGWSLEEAQTATRLLAARGIVAEHDDMLRLQTQAKRPALQVQAEKEDQREIWIETLQRQIGRLRSRRSAVTIRFSGPLATHLGSVAENLSKQQEKLIASCRRQLDVLKAEKTKISGKQIEREIRRIEQASDELDSKQRNLEKWRNIDNDLERLVQELRIIRLESLQNLVKNLIGDLREGFATDAWRALQSPDSVHNQVEKHVRALQACRYDRARAFWKCRQTWGNALGNWADGLVQTTLPDLEDFDADPDRAWERLHAWVIEVGASLLQKLPETLSRKHRWRDPFGTQSSYGDVRKLALTALEKASAQSDHEHLDRLSEQISRLCRGFPDEVILSDPDLPMDFERIKALLQSGRAVIKMGGDDA